LKFAGFGAGVIIELVVVVGLMFTPVTLGTASGPDPISIIFSEVALITACARGTFLLSRSYTTYALLRKESPKTKLPIVDDWIPNRHCVGERFCGRINWLMGTLIVIPVNLYSTVKRLDARLQSTYALLLLITAFTAVKIDWASAAGTRIMVLPLSSTKAPGFEPPFRSIRFPALFLICTSCSITKNASMDG